ncbi:MAG: glycoside hydrolase family 3 C-terminal domain-containing protein, partial [Treponema sp.]|nr:glycoside hydrolase family 3 C-terminal domain-containing protein [Treponema sp.]
TVEGANNGEDLEMCATIVYGDKLVKAVKDGLVPEDRIDEAALRIVRTVTAFEESWRASGKHYGLETIGCVEHCALALRSARESITLLQNRQGTLPFKRQRVKKLALIGALGSADNIGDHGSSRVYPAHIKTPLEGLINMAPDIEIIYYDGNSLDHVRLLAREADAVVIIAGLDYQDEGEYVSEEQAQDYISSPMEGSNLGGDRKDGLGLHKGDIALIEAAGLENQNSVVVLMGGGALLLDGWKDCVSAILLAYYPGQEGGTALAEILFGEVNPSGKLPFVIPVDEGDLLPQPVRSLNWDTENQHYDYYHGYTRLEKEGIAAMLPFGFGLSYTRFAISEPAFGVDARQVTASCWVKNIGEQAGDEVIQLYVGFKQSRIDRPVKLLRGFTRVSLEPGAGERVYLSCPLEKLKFYNPKTGEFELESMSYEVYIGSSSAERDLLKGSISL